MLGPSAKAALRALRDVGAVRASWNHPGYRALRVHRFVTYQAHGDEFLYRLSPRGEVYARKIFR